MSGRHAVVWTPLAVARILGYVVAADDRRSVHRGREYRRRPRMPEILECRPRGAGKCIERELLALVVDDVVEESAELRAGQLRRRVGHRLDYAFDIEL